VLEGEMEDDDVEKLSKEIFDAIDKKNYE